MNVCNIFHKKTDFMHIFTFRSRLHSNLTSIRRRKKRWKKNKKHHHNWKLSNGNIDITIFMSLKHLPSFNGKNIYYIAWLCINCQFLNWFIFPFAQMCDYFKSWGVFIFSRLATYSVNHVWLSIEGKIYIIHLMLFSDISLVGSHKWLLFRPRIYGNKTPYLYQI